MIKLHDEYFFPSNIGTLCCQKLCVVSHLKCVQQISFHSFQYCHYLFSEGHHEHCSLCSWREILRKKGANFLCDSCNTVHPNVESTLSHGLLVVFKSSQKRLLASQKYPAVGNCSVRHCVYGKSGLWVSERLQLHIQEKTDTLQYYRVSQQGLGIDNLTTLQGRYFQTDWWQTQLVSASNFFAKGQILCVVPGFPSW